MRKALLYLKVIFLLVALGGVSSSHAAKSDNPSFLGLSSFDFIINVSEQSSSEDESSLVVESKLLFVEFLSAPAHYSPLLKQTRNTASKPYARGPPAILPA